MMYISQDSLNYIKNFCSRISHFYVVGQNLLNITRRYSDDIIHLNQTMNWLKRAQDVTYSGGVSAAYSIIHGWLPAYPETTGYIIQTFIAYASFFNKQDFLRRAMLMGDWEIKIQLPNGGVRALFGLKDYPDVFNTGQVIIGWGDLYNETRKKKYLEAAIKAGDWLVNEQDNIGCWSKNSLNNIPHSYHSRVAYSLLKLFNISHNSKYKTAAEKNIKWILSNYVKNDWINYMGFFEDLPPLTHTISYTLEGLLESKIFLDIQTQKHIETITYTIGRELCKIYLERQTKKSIFLRGKLLPATFNNGWKSKDKYSCITGDSQLCWVWFKLYEQYRERQFLNAAELLLNQIKSIQFIKIKDKNINGGIPGSYPIWGAYSQYSYPNWAAKFFADTLLYKIAKNL